MEDPVLASHEINYSFGSHTDKLNYLLQVAWMSRNAPTPYAQGIKKKKTKKKPQHIKSPKQQKTKTF